MDKELLAFREQQHQRKSIRDAMAELLGAWEPDIKKLLGGARVKIRGSLATGIRSIKKEADVGSRKNPNVAAQEFSAASYDCDAFIEVSDQIWNMILADSNVSRWASYAFLGNITARPDTQRSRQLVEILAELRRIEAIIRLNIEHTEELRGYNRGRGGVDFEFVIRSRSNVGGLYQYGNPHTSGSLFGIRLDKTENYGSEGQPGYREPQTRDTGHGHLTFMPERQGVVTESGYESEDEDAFKTFSAARDAK